MALDTFSIFYYGFTIDSTNQNLNFNEGSGELTAVLTPGTYAMDEMRLVIKTAMDAVGVNEYTVTIDRATRAFTIASIGNNFDLLLSSGSQVGTSPFTLLGFSQGVDLTGTDTYTSATAAGDFYEPQFKLQDYVDPEMFQERIDATNNESASGKIESVAFGTRKFINLSVKFVTNIPMDNKVIKNNPTGKSDLERFLQDIIKKGKFEFMADIDDRDTFTTVLVESLPGNNKGTGYRLTELVGQNLPGIFEVNNIRLRVAE